MALCHDVAEAIVGDITPHCNVSPEEKKRLESTAIATIKQMLGVDTAAGEEVYHHLGLKHRYQYQYACP